MIKCKKFIHCRSKKGTKTSVHSRNRETARTIRSQPKRRNSASHPDTAETEKRREPSGHGQNGETAQTTAKTKETAWKLGTGRTGTNAWAGHPAEKREKNHGKQRKAVGGEDILQHLKGNRRKRTDRQAVADGAAG